MIDEVEVDTKIDQAAGYVLEDQIGFVLREAHQRASEKFNKVMGAFEVTPTQFAALAKLYDEGEVSQNRLGRLTAMDPATILGVITRLKKRGFIDQRLDPSDGRRILLRLSQAGRSATADMRAVARKVSMSILEPLSERQSAELVHLLRAIS